MQSNTTATRTVPRPLIIDHRALAAIVSLVSLDFSRTGLIRRHSGVLSVVQNTVQTLAKVEVFSP